MNIPTYLTILRILLCPFFFLMLITYSGGNENHRILAFIIFAAATVTDALDGLLARALKQQTRIGTLLDPLADKLLLVSGYIGLLFVNTLHYSPPLWVTVTIVFRDIFLIGGMIVIFILTGDLRVHPNFLGKMTTFFQMTALAAILLQWSLAVPCYYAAALLTILSGIVYGCRELKLLKNFSNGKVKG